MRTLNRNKRLLYLCSKYKEGNLIKYKEPVPLRENYQPTSTDGDLIAIGMDYPKYLRMKIDMVDKNKFKPKDRLYIYVDKPLEHDVLCKDADYEVYKRPSIYLDSVEVMLRRLSGDDDE